MRLHIWAQRLGNLHLLTHFPKCTHRVLVEALIRSALSSLLLQPDDLIPYPTLHQSLQEGIKGFLFRL